MEMAYRGHLICFDAVKEMVAAMLCDAVCIWEQDILLGLPDIRINYNGYIQDDLTNQDVGYSFLTDPANPFQSSSSILLDAFLSNKRTTNFFFSLDRHGQPDYYPFGGSWLGLMEG
jgi:hypothetical protein